MAPAEGTSQSDKKVFSLNPFLPLLHEVFDREIFGKRAKLNFELWELLKRDTTFVADLRKARQDKTMKIPNLKASLDIRSAFVQYGDSEMEVTESYYLSSLSPEKKKIINNRIKSILNKYKLPLNFYEFVQYVLLYKKFPKGQPLFNLEFLDQIENNPNEATRLPISTIEKKFIFRLFRMRRGIKEGRMPKKYAQEFKKLKTMLDSSAKDGRRRMRTIDDALKILDMEKEEVAEPDTDTGSTVFRKKKMRDQAVEKANLELSKDAEDREFARLRQVKSRLSKRKKNLK